MTDSNCGDDFLKHGFGTIYRKNGTKWYVGSWRNGKRCEGSEYNEYEVK